MLLMIRLSNRIVVIFLCFLLFAGCSADDYNPTTSFVIAEGVTISAENDSYYTNDEYINLVITNESNNKIIYGEGTIFEIFNDDSWIAVKYRRNFGFNDRAYTLLPNESAIIVAYLIALEDFPPSTGLYRLRGKDIWFLDGSESYVGASNQDKNQSIEWFVEFNLVNYE